MDTTNAKKIKIKDLLIPLFTAVLFSVFLPIFVYTNNIEEAAFKEVFPLILLFAGIGAVIFFALFFCLKKNIFLSTVTSVLLILGLSNYALIEKVITKPFPRVEGWSFIVITVCVIALLAPVINKYVPETAREFIPPVLLLVISVLIVLNVIIALPKGIQKLSVPDDIVTEPAVQTPAVSDSDMPNVYYLLFDEYSNSEMIKKYYGYDNSDFDRYLEEKGFSVSPNTQNGSYDTTVITANYMNFNYVVNGDASTAEKTKARKNNRLTELFNSNDYKIVGVGDSSFLGIPSITESGDSESATVNGEPIEKIILANTVYKLVYDNAESEDGSDILNALNYFSKTNLERNSGRNTFTVFYVCSPHPPYLFDKDGTLNNPEDYSNLNNPEIYLNQYIYITGMMQKMIDNILEYDENCVIIIQSDHAMRHAPGIVPEDQLKPLNAVYYRGENIDEIKGQSGVNTIRLVLNRLFDMDLEVLEVTE